MSTFLSNHTLTCLGHATGDLESHLLMNYDDDKGLVARRKIMKYHYRDAINIQRFVDTQLEILPLLPHAIAWMAKNVTIFLWNKNDRFSLLYQFVKSMTSFFEFNSGT